MAIIARWRESLLYALDDGRLMGVPYCPGVPQKSRKPKFVKFCRTAEAKPRSIMSEFDALGLNHATGRYIHKTPNASKLGASSRPIARQFPNSGPR